jgi:2',3'-cyclic-nucleotide 2'-phosphodiesterase (5'-nucleotidase family)
LLEDAMGVELEPVGAVAETLHLLQETPSIQDAYTILGTTKHTLEGTRESVRFRKTNLGRIIADSTFWAANLHATATRIQPVDIARKNAGGIRGTLSPAKRCPCKIESGYLR